MNTIKEIAEEFNARVDFRRAAHRKYMSRGTIDAIQALEKDIIDNRLPKVLNDEYSTGYVNLTKEEHLLLYNEVNHLNAYIGKEHLKYKEEQEFSFHGGIILKLEK